MNRRRQQANKRSSSLLTSTSYTLTVSWVPLTLILLLYTTGLSIGDSAADVKPPGTEGAEESENANVTKLNYTLTGNPQIDYIYDPNLPRELNGYNLSEYPFYSRVPKNVNYSCDGLKDGFYANTEHKCQIYHQCVSGARYDFLCANFTAFDQKTFICTFVSTVDCENSALFFYRNKDLYWENSTSTAAPIVIPSRDIYTRRPSKLYETAKVQLGGDRPFRNKQRQEKPSGGAAEVREEEPTYGGVYEDPEEDSDEYDTRPLRSRQRPKRPKTRIPRKCRKFRNARARRRCITNSRPRLRPDYYEDEYYYNEDEDEYDYDEDEDYYTDRKQKPLRRNKQGNGNKVKIAGSALVESVSAAAVEKETGKSSSDVTKAPPTTTTTTTTTAAPEIIYEDEVIDPPAKLIENRGKILSKPRPTPKILPPKQQGRNVPSGPQKVTSAAPPPQEDEYYDEDVKETPKPQKASTTTTTTTTEIPKPTTPSPRTRLFNFRTSTAKANRSSKTTTTTQSPTTPSTTTTVAADEPPSSTARAAASQRFSPSSAFRATPSTATTATTTTTTAEPEYEYVYEDDYESPDIPVSSEKSTPAKPPTTTTTTTTTTTARPSRLNSGRGNKRPYNSLSSIGGSTSVSSIQSSTSVTVQEPDPFDEGSDSVRRNTVDKRRSPWTRNQSTRTSLLAGVPTPNSIVSTSEKFPVKEIQDYRSQEPVITVKSAPSPQPILSSSSSRTTSGGGRTTESPGSKQRPSKFWQRPSKAVPIPSSTTTTTESSADYGDYSEEPETIQAPAPPPPPPPSSPPRYNSNSNSNRFRPSLSSSPTTSYSQSQSSSSDDAYSPNTQYSRQPQQQQQQQPVNNNQYATGNSNQYLRSTQNTYRQQSSTRTPLEPETTNSNNYLSSSYRQPQSSLGTSSARPEFISLLSDDDDPYYDVRSQPIQPQQASSSNSGGSSRRLPNPQRPQYFGGSQPYHQTQTKLYGSAQESYPTYVSPPARFSPNVGFMHDMNQGFRPSRPAPPMLYGPPPNSRRNSPPHHMLFQM